MLHLPRWLPATRNEMNQRQKCSVVVADGDCGGVGVGIGVGSVLLWR